MDHKITSKARESSIRFLYYCEIHRIYYFSSVHFQSFAEYFGLAPEVRKLAFRFCQGCLEKLKSIDEVIESSSPNWQVSRMATTDRAILRLATYEIMESSVPIKVILNEAIRSAKIYGLEHSGKFVNGVLDSIAKAQRKEESST